MSPVAPRAMGEIWHYGHDTDMALKMVAVEYLITAGQMYASE